MFYDYRKLKKYKKVYCIIVYYYTYNSMDVFQCFAVNLVAVNHSFHDAKFTFLTSGKSAGYIMLYVSHVHIADEVLNLLLRDVV